MRKLNTTITALMLVGFLSYGSAALAQYDDDDSDTPAALFGPQAGISKVDGEEANFIFGAAMRFRFIPLLGLEGSINYRQEKFGDDALTVRSWPVQITGMLYPLSWIYGSMGAGWYMTTFDYDPDLVFLDDDTQSEFGWHFGGGLEIPLGSVANLAADLRYVFIDYNFEDFPGSDDIESNFYMATAGILFRL